MYSFNFHSVVLLHLFSTARIGSHALFQVVAYYSVLQTSWHVVANIPQTSIMLVMLTRSIVFFYFGFNFKGFACILNGNGARKIV